MEELLISAICHHGSAILDSFLAFSRLLRLAHAFDVISFSLLPPLSSPRYTRSAGYMGDLNLKVGTVTQHGHRCSKTRAVAVSTQSQNGSSFQCHDEAGPDMHMRVCRYIQVRALHVQVSLQYVETRPSCMFPEAV